MAYQFESEYSYEKDADGIVTYTMDCSGQSANTMNQGWYDGICEVLDRLEAEEGLTGLVIASAKKTFFAGGDLGNMLASDPAPEALFAWVEKFKAPYRRLERLKVPVAVAINGAALGGGYEICLAANHRVIVNDPRAKVGLPEVGLGLLPGAGGVVRMTYKLGLEKALPYLLEGKQRDPQKALAEGLVDEVVETPDALIPAAKAWIKANPEAHTQPWDLKGFRFPGGDATSPKVRQIVVAAPTMLFQKTRGLMPAPEKILDVAVNAMRMGFDSALRTESRGFTGLLGGPQSRAAINTFFFGMQAVKSGKVRPEGDRWKAATSTVLGAGMMGGGIAYAHAARGLPVVLKDRDQAAADKGKNYSATITGKAVKRGRMSEADQQAHMDRITATDDYAKAGGADVVVEAVFEDIGVKEQVIKESFALLSEDGIYGSNTSTLPISFLQGFAPDPSRFIGLHFFSPVDKMKVVEIIVGRDTSEDTLRKAYDYVQQIGYMPIVVNDARGFFTSRVFSTYLDEGLMLLRDGMDPVAIERAGWKAGMPVGPLQVHDEVSMELTRKITATHRDLDKLLGENTEFGKDNVGVYEIAPRMCELGRRGRHWDGAGFYDYDEAGNRTLWDGLSQFVVEDRQVSMEDAMDRLIYRQSIETLRCLDENVLRTEVEGNLGSIFAIGFPAYTGGALQYIRYVGLDAFKARADQLAETYGERFRVTDGQMRLLDQTSDIAAE